MDNAAVFTWMLPNIKEQRRTLMQAKLDAAIYQYGFTLCFKERMDEWMRSFGVSDYGHCYPLAFIQAWGQTHGYTITTNPEGQGTRLVIGDDRTTIRTKPIPTMCATDEGFYDYPAGAKADLYEAEFTEDELCIALKQLVSDVLNQFRRELKAIAFGPEFYQGIFRSRYIEDRIGYAIEPDHTPWMVHGIIMRTMRDIESTLTELSKTGGTHESARP